MRFTPVSSQHMNSVSSQRRGRSKRQAWMTRLSFVALIGLGTSFWVVLEAISLTPSFANAPHSAQASTKTLDLYAERHPNESYESLWRRAQEAALATAQQSFESDRQISKVVIMVTAENNGSVAPLLTLEVSRDQWERGIQPERWITNVNSSRRLLGFEKPKPTTTVDAQSSESLPTNSLPTQPPGSPL